MANAGRRERAKGPEPFVTLPYLDRKLVVVVDDEVVALARKLKRNPADVAEAEWKQALVDARGSTSGPGMITLGMEVREVCRKARSEKVLVFLAAQSEALQLDFPVGHPAHGVLYVGHPAAPRRYLPMADFHRSLFEHKVAEAIRLLVALGATDLAIEHVSGWANIKEVGINLAGADIKPGGVKEGSGQVVMKMTLRPRGAARIPDGLIWYEHEPLWQAVAEARLQSGLTSFELDVRYIDDFNINAKLSLKVGKIGLEIGGKFTEHKETVWHLRGAFAEPATT